LDSGNRSKAEPDPVFIIFVFGEVMKKVILAVLLTAIALFLILPSLSWAQEDLYKAKCSACHGADGKGTAAGKKMGSPEFSSPAVQKASNADLVDYIENGGPQKKPSHAFANRGVSPADAAKLATYVKSLK
jgi:cytochrome c553